MKHKFSFEYDESTKKIIQSLCGKSYLTPKDIQRLFLTLLINAYDPKKSKRII